MENGPTEVTVEGWVDDWNERKIGFHKTERHEKLVQYKDTLINGRTEAKFFFPLCGKALDMKWMYDEGHTVVGVEGASKAIEEFFDENNMKYSTEKLTDIEGDLYKSEDGRLRIYCCDFFMFSPALEKDFTAVFDRGSFVAINMDDRRRYAETMLPLLAPDCRYLLLTVIYDGSLFSGPPHWSTDEDIIAAFGDKCNIELLSIDDALDEGDAEWKLKELHERSQLLTIKEK